MLLLTYMDQKYKNIYYIKFAPKSLMTRELLKMSFPALASHFCSQVAMVLGILSSAMYLLMAFSLSI